MTHKFKDEIIDWLNGSEYEYQLGARWEPLDRLEFFDIVVNIRKVEEKPKTKKMVQWLMKTSLGEYYVAQELFHVGVRPTSFYMPIKPLPHTEIEVEE